MRYIFEIACVSKDQGLLRQNVPAAIISAEVKSKYSTVTWINLYISYAADVENIYRPNKYIQVGKLNYFLQIF